MIADNDWNFNEDRSRVRTGFGPENLTRLRRFAIGILKSFQKPSQSIAEMMRTLCFRTRLVFDYLRMTKTLRPQCLEVAENKFTVAELSWIIIPIIRGYITLLAVILLFRRNGHQATRLTKPRHAFFPTPHA